jgi:hypothetical protein
MAFKSRKTQKGVPSQHDEFKKFKKSYEMEVPKLWENRYLPFHKILEIKKKIKKFTYALGTMSNYAYKFFKGDFSPIKVNCLNLGTSVKTMILCSNKITTLYMDNLNQKYRKSSPFGMEIISFD